MLEFDLAETPQNRAMSQGYITRIIYCFCYSSCHLQSISLYFMAVMQVHTWLNVSSKCN